jgi:transcriptional regulator with XRE-family HTH domain
MQSDTLRLFRLSKNLKQQIIANLLGMSQANYSNLENGKTKINPVAARKLASYYRVSEDHFLHQNDPDNNPAIKGQNQYVNKTDQYVEPNEALLEPLLERMDLLLNILADEKEELTFERKQLSAMVDKLANKFGIQL